MFDHVGRECDAVGLPFVRPARSPNTRHVLGAAEHVRLTQPQAFDALIDFVASVRVQHVVPTTHGNLLERVGVVHCNAKAAAEEAEETAESLAPSQAC